MLAPRKKLQNQSLLENKMYGQGTNNMEEKLNFIIGPNNEDILWYSKTFDSDSLGFIVDCFLARPEYSYTVQQQTP